MVATGAVTLPRVPSALRRNLASKSNSCCSMSSTHLVYSTQVHPARFTVSCVLSSPSQVNHSAKFVQTSKSGNLFPLYQCIYSDQLTPVLAYRCLVDENDHEAPSFLFESVETESQTSTMGRYSIVGANPAMEIVAKENSVTVMDHREGWRTEECLEDPFMVPKQITERWTPQLIDEFPKVFSGGWVGYFSYDTVRYAEKRLTFASAPVDDRSLPDMHLGLYDDVLVFDHVEKKIYVIHWVQLDRFPSKEEALNNGKNRLKSLLSKVYDITNPRLSAGTIELDAQKLRSKLESSHIASEAYHKAILRAKEHILAGDTLQLELSQRIERRTFSDPFEVYRALGIVNPSPFMAYLQVRGCNLIASSPKMVTVERKQNSINGSFSGTRRSASVLEDSLLDKQLLNGRRHYKEHSKLARWTNGDVRKVTDVSSTCWDALQAALHGDGVTSVPKIKTMKLIDELEVNRRGPYGGGFACVSFSGNIDMAIASRSVVFPTRKRYDSLFSYKNETKRREWVADIHAGATILADSDPRDIERQCKSEATELARAIDLAESSFIDKD